MISNIYGQLFFFGVFFWQTQAAKKNPFRVLLYQIQEEELICYMTPDLILLTGTSAALTGRYQLFFQAFVPARAWSDVIINETQERKSTLKR